jgi:hypothetical protein
MATGYIFGNSFNSDKGANKGQYFQIGRVKSVVLGPYKGGTKERDPDYNSPSDLGKIRYEIMYSRLGTSLSREVSEPAYPMSGFLKQYPIINEIVLIITGPSDGLNDGYSKQKQFYFPPYNLWNDSNHNAFPNLNEWADFLNNYVNLPGYSGNSVTSPKLPLGYTFQEKVVRNLQPFEGDVILQSRFGQSVRFGTTVPEQKNSNTWSNSGNTGDPITIITNQQGYRAELSKFDTFIEDINRDGSSIYMTSTQEINIDLSNFPLNSFKTTIKPVTQTVLEVARVPISNYGTSAAEQDQNSTQ